MSFDDALIRSDLGIEICPTLLVFLSFFFEFFQLGHFLVLLSTFQFT